MPFQAQDELRKQAKFSKIIKFVGHNVSVIALNSNGRDIIGVLSFRDYTGYVFDSVFVRHVDRETLVKEYFSLEEKLYHTVAGVRDEESQLRDTLYINDFANIAEGLPNDTGIIVNVSTNEKLTLSLERLKKKSNEEALLKKIEGNPVFIDIHVISTDPRETYLLRETITRNSNIDLAWMQINPISPLEVRNLIEPQIYRRGSILQRFWEGKLLSPTTTVAELMEWLELPIPSRVIDYFRNSFKIKRESGITIGKLMNDRDYKIAASDYPVYVYAESRLGRDVIKILAHNVSNPIVVDIVGTVSEELAKETQLPFLMPPFFGLNPLVKSQPVIEGVLRILKVEDPLLQRTFEGLVNALPDPTIPKIYKLLYETLHADIIPYTTENWVTYLAEFKKLRYKRALHLLTVLGRVVNVRDIRLTLSEDTINTDDLKSGAIISIPAHKYSPRLASIVASLLILRLWNDLKNTVFLINAGTEHLPVLKYLISDLGFKRVVYVTSSPRLPAHFKTRLYEFKKKNIMFLDGYLTLVYVKKAEYPIIREKVAPEKLIPAEPELPELPIEPTKTRERMNGVLRLMIDSEFVELDELLERVRSVEGIVMSPTPSEIESFLKNLEEELRKVHRSDLGFRLTQIAYLHYVKKGFLDVRPAAQRPDTIRPDLEVPSKHILVEVEAENVSKAVEQVKRNMLKWKDVTRVWEVACVDKY